MKQDAPQYKIKAEPTGDYLPKTKIESAEDSAAFARLFYADDIGIYESFFMFSVSDPLYVTGWLKVSQGGVSSTIVDPKLVARFALDTLAFGVILVHNHPSGSLRPSDADRRITSKIKEGLALFEIKVLDHIILTQDDFYSFADEGEI